MSDRYLRIQGGNRTPLDTVVLEAITRFRERFNTDPSTVLVPLCGIPGIDSWYVQGIVVLGARHLHFQGTGHDFTWQAEAGPVPVNAL